MTDTAISVENLSKSYLIGHNSGKAERYTALRDVLARGARNIARNARDVFKGRAIVQGDEVEEFWALKDVSFEINKGDRVGIIGRNGAGKSTLLKILSRIAEPTSGRIKISGRVASLLEVGTGFHPELTGRENIYLNGAILGMTRKEIQRNFDEIVAFAEVEKFLDTPVKRYSSGMYVRLAFSVAAHLETEILIVDEVLAVGDIAFQQKCMTRMSEVAEHGRTLLFVSHNMGAISQLCNSAILLNQGQLVEQSNNVGSLVQNYLNGGATNSDASWVNSSSAYNNEWFTPKTFYVGTESGARISETLGINSDIYIYIEGDCKQSNPATQVGVAVYGTDGQLIFWSFTTDSNSNWVGIKAGFNRLRLTIPAYTLNEGVYSAELAVALHEHSWICQPGKNSPGIGLNIRGGFVGSNYWTQKRPGLLAPKYSWRNGV